MLNIALKEWSVVCDLMLEGRLAILLRKGGIAESGGPGVFVLEHPRFVLFPSWAHQQPHMIKAAFRDRVERFESEPPQITFRALAAVEKIWPVTDREKFDQLEDLHCWSDPQIDMRFQYRPLRPLVLLAVRVYRLERPKAIRNCPEYGGCRSWVELHEGDEVEDQGAEPVLDGGRFVRIVERIDDALGSSDQ